MSKDDNLHDCTSKYEPFCLGCSRCQMQERNERTTIGLGGPWTEMMASGPNSTAKDSRVEKIVASLLVSINLLGELADPRGDVETAASIVKARLETCVEMLRKAHERLP